MTPEQEFRHQLIQEEFRSILTQETYELPIDTDAILVLSAAPEKDAEGNVVREDSQENIDRIRFGVDLYRQIVSARHGMNPPRLILDGEAEQLPMMKELTLAEGIRSDMIDYIDCGRRGVGNTRTQFESLVSNLGFTDCQHYTVVTSPYHAPRVVRTADKVFPQDISFDVIPVPNSKPASVYRAVKGEVRRIVTYAAKGDISKTVDPRRIVH